MDSFYVIKFFHTGFYDITAINNKSQVPGCSLDHSFGHFLTFVRSGVIRSWVVRSGSGVVRSWVSFGSIRFGFVFGVDSFTGVSDISDISGVTVSNGVSYGLDTTIGKGDMVFTVGGITITSFVGTEIGSGVIISNGVSVIVSGGYISVCWGSWVVWGWGIRGSRGGKGGGHEGRDGNEDLLIEIYELLSFFFV
jgi:hypothetical protein